MLSQEHQKVPDVTKCPLGPLAESHCADLRGCQYSGLGPLHLSGACPYAYTLVHGSSDLSLPESGTWSENGKQVSFSPPTPCPRGIPLTGIYIIG